MILQERHPPVDGGRTVKAICYGVQDFDVLTCPEEGALLLWRLSFEIGMKGIEEIRVRFGPTFGYSAVLVIEESHIAVHTWTETGDLRIIVDTCKGFSKRTLKEFLNRELCPNYIHISEIRRNRPASWVRLYLKARKHLSRSRIGRRNGTRKEK